MRCIVSHCLWLVPILLWASCSVNDLASGTGVGNPGITKVSIRAAENPDTTALNILPSVKNEITSIDKGGLLFTVTAITINVEYFRFLTADEQKAEIPLNGPFIFDAISGQPTPEIKNFFLPTGKYAEMRCYITNKNSTTVPYAFELSGYFDYKNQKHEFRFKLESRELAAYKYKGPAFTINAEDSTLFSLILNADLWLKKVDIGASLDNSSISLDPSGDLIFDNTTTGQEYDKIKKSIAKSIIQSGYLLITSLD